MIGHKSEIQTMTISSDLRARNESDQSQLWFQRNVQEYIFPH